MTDKGLKIVFLFSGQGSQYRGMGEKLFENNKVFRKSIEQSDALVRKLINRSLIHELYEVDQLEFNDLLITHPAIVSVEIALYNMLQEMGIKPDYVAGNSLGEFAAGVVSKAWSIETALEVCIEQAKSILRSDIYGGMIAIVNQKKDALENLIVKNGLFLASDNFPGHFTISGSTENINEFQAELKSMEVTFFRLPVNHPFHSPLIERALTSFEYYLSCLPPFSDPWPGIGFISGIKFKELEKIPTNYLKEVVSSYTDFPALVKYLEVKGSYLYIDLGSSGTMATFVKYNLSKISLSQTFQIMTPFKKEIEQLEILQKLIQI